MIFDVNNCTEQNKKDFFNFWKSGYEGHVFHTRNGDYALKELVSVTVENKDTGTKVTIYGDTDKEGDIDASNNS